MFGIIFALLAAIFWGSYVVPMIKLKESPFLIVSILTTTTFVVSLILYFVLSPGLTTNIILFGLIAGFFWSLAQIYALIGLKKMKFGRFYAISSSAQILLNFIWGVVIFYEILGGGYFNFLMAFIGIVLLILGVYNVSVIREKGKSELSKVGLSLAILAALLWSLQFISIRFASANPFSIVVPMTLGMSVTSWTYTLLKDRKVSASISTLKMSSLGGIIWVTGNYLGFFAINEIGLARAFSITQIANLVAVLWSILYFKEFLEKKNVFLLIVSAILIILGAGLMAFAKT